MRQIEIGFSKSKKRFAIGSWLIRKYLRTPYSHVYLKFHSESLNRTLIYEAVGSGLRFIGSEAWKGHAVEVKSFTINILPANYITLMQYCIDHAGMDYGFMQNIGVVAADLLSMKSNPFQKGKNCSEVISDILRLEGYTLHASPNLSTPRDVYEILDQ